MRPAFSLRISALLLTLSVIFVDQFSKLWIFQWLDQQNTGSVAILPFLNLVKVWNSGISFGMFHNFSHSAWAFTLLSSVISVGLVIWLWMVRHWWLTIALSLVLGGAIGNIIDRIRFKAVADFIDIYWKDYHWPAFNIADSAICVGVIMICLDHYLYSKQNQPLLKPDTVK